MASTGAGGAGAFGQNTHGPTIRINAGVNVSDAARTIVSPKEIAIPASWNLPNSAKTIMPMPQITVPALAHHYLRKHAQELHKGDLRLAEETIDFLLLYRWPGNVRQLANEMRRMAVLAEKGAVLMPEHLSPEIAASRRTIPASERTLDDTEVVVRVDQPMPAAVGHLERTMIQMAMKKCGGRMEETAALLGISRKGLYLKRQRYGFADNEPPEAAEAG